MSKVRRRNFRTAGESGLVLTLGFILFANYAAMGITNVAEHMKSGILVKTPTDDVQNGFNKTWGELKALKQ